MGKEVLLNIKCEYSELVEVSQLVPNPKNPNKHPDDQIKRLSQIIDYQGMRSPIVVSKRSGFITKGHGRLAALKLLGWDKAPVDFQDYESEAQEYADMVADNAIAEWAAQDLGEINLKMLDLGPDLDVDMLGIKDFAIEPIEKYNEEKEDDVPEVKHYPVTRRGDVWLLGNHRVMCGDSTIIDDVEKLMNGEKADMVYTDPPYGMNLDTNYDQMHKDDGSHTKTGNRFERVIGDDEDYDPGDVLRIFSDIKEVWLWGCDYFYTRLPAGGSMSCWDKRSESLDKVPGNTTEFLWSKTPHRRMTARVKWSGHHGMQSDDTRKRVHPTQKPTRLHEWFFENYGNKKGLIVDVYLGSGSTLIACEKTNRKCYGMELDEHYCDVIINRWQQFTGKEATLESTGKTYGETKETT